MRLLSALLVLPAALPVHGSAIDRRIDRRDDIPKYGYDPSTTKYCTWWYDNEDNSIACKDMAASNGITLQQWERWNPAVAQSCSNFRINQSYCVEALNEPASATSSTIAQTRTTTTYTTTGTTTTTTTSTKPTNGIPTPTPTQPGMVDNCNQFYYVNPGDGCQAIADKHGITIQQFTSWNTQVGGTSCSGLWANAYVCVNIVGRDPTPTKPDNGIQTPSPIQPDIIDTCAKFYMVRSGESCSAVAGANSITVSDFVSWNRKVSSDCSGLWADTYACVAVIGKYDFEKNIAGWNVVDGAFGVNEGALVATNPNGKAIIAAAMNDLVMEADVTLPGQSGNGGLIFRTSNVHSGSEAYQGYYVGLSTKNGGSVVVGRSDNAWKELQITAMSIQPNRVYHVSVKALADQITVSVDGVEKLRVTDGTFRSGGCGVRVWQTTMTVDNIIIKPAVFDGFEKNMVGWSIADGGFDAHSHVMVASNVDSGKTVLNTQFKDFALDVDVSLSTASGNAGIIFRASNVRSGSEAYQGYYVGLESNGWLTLGRGNNGWTFLRNANVGIRVGTTYKLRVVARGSSISVFLTDMNSAVMQLDDATFASGMIGARVWKSGGTYDNFAIVPL